MRQILLIAILGLFFAVPAQAGNLVVIENKLHWQSTECTPPQVPPSVVQADRQTGANDMNTLVTKYNEYVLASQAYMSCLSAESEKDADMASSEITTNAKENIDALQKELTRLGTVIEAK